VCDIDPCNTDELGLRRWHALWYGNVAFKERIKIKRAYDDPAHDDGVRVLVDRFWPRGLSKARAHVDLWLKDLAPSSPLRRWFNHDPARWVEFRRRYARELDAKDRAIAALRGAARRGRVTLLFSAHDPEHNNAVALGSYLARRRTV
jgi:uncharacterized protein YeaO (DUF488 family)